MLKLRNSNKGDSNPGSLDCESGILPLSYRAPLISCTHEVNLREHSDDAYGWCEGNKELRAVGVCSSVRHAQRVRPVVLQGWVKLVFKFTAPNRLSTRAIAYRETMFMNTNKSKYILGTKSIQMQVYII